MHDFDLAALLADAARQLETQQEERPTVETIVSKAVELVTDCESASVTVRSRRKGFVTLGSTDDAARQADELQYASHEGPCVETAEAADWLRSGQVGTDVRWPTWGPQAAAIGVGSMLSVALYARHERIGALNLYTRQSEAFADRDEVDMALLFAVHAAQALASARQVSGLQAAVDSRHTIGMAQGILIERYALTPDQAFAVLRRVSSHTQVKVSTLARQIVETGVVPSLDA